MFYDSTMPMPGVLRLRALHPLIEGDGSCSLVYDLERAAVVEVPEELTFYIATALETGDLDEALLAWLVNEDLLTDEGCAGTAGGGVPPEAAIWWHSGTLYRVDDELHARIDQVREEAALDVVRFAFGQGFGASRVKLHLNWDGCYPGNGLLERIVVEASRLAASLHQEAAFELTLDAGEVTPARAAFLAASAFQVRLRCGGYPVSSLADRGAAAAWKAEPLVRRLVKRLRDRLTVHCVLDGGRLLDLWEWAKRMGIRHLDATLVEDSAIGDGSQRPGRRIELRNDLQAVCDEMADELAAQRMPVNYKPLTRIVDRLMRSESLDETAGDRGGFAGLVPVADSYPRSLLATFDLRSLARSLDGAAAAGAAGEASETDFPCPGCWARHVCSHSTFVAAAEGEEARDISEDSCSLWKVEVEVALRFYHRLAHTDPLQVRRFFDSATREPAQELGEEPGPMRMPF